MRSIVEVLSMPTPQPVHVTKGTDGKYTLVSGLMRVKAAQTLDVPVRCEIRYPDGTTHNGEVRPDGSVVET